MPLWKNVHNIPSQQVVNTHWPHGAEPSHVNLVSQNPGMGLHLFQLVPAQSLLKDVSASHTPASWQRSRPTYCPCA